MKIGVFDSGVGGESVANALESALPEHQVIFMHDRQNIPYGTKTNAELLSLVAPILQKLDRSGCGLIVIACNTVTTNIISELRNTIKTPLIGIEPLIGPASKLTKSGVVTVCATPATLNSDRYKALKRENASSLRVIEPDCSDWARMIEDNDVDEHKIRSIVDQSLSQDSDVFVLGCTHYHWIEDIIDDMTADKAVVLQPEDAIVDRVKQMISDLAPQS